MKKPKKKGKSKLKEIKLYLEIAKSLLEILALLLTIIK